LPSRSPIFSTTAWDCPATTAWPWRAGRHASRATSPPTAKEEGAVSHLRFLANLHGLKRIILISHEGCGFYRDFLRVRDFDLLHRMRQDLVRAARRVRDATTRLDVEAYLARVDGTEVWFEEVATDK